MVVKIRLARFGKCNAPFYNIVVAQARYSTPPPKGKGRVSSIYLKETTYGDGAQINQASFVSGAPTLS